MSSGNIPADWLPQYTYSDYKLWQGDWELIRGIPFAMSPSAHRRHQFVGGKFVTLVNNYLNDKNDCKCEVLYECDWIINEHTVVKPDVMIICDVPSSDFVHTPPVFVLEIFSNSTRLKDRNIKFNLYESNGVKYYLMADPEKDSLEIFQLKDNRYQEINSSKFQLSNSCTIEIDLQKIWQ